MEETLYQTGNGGGLAANQVGILRRLVVIDVDGHLYKLVNPEVVSREGTQHVSEGCLSFPELWGKVDRPEKLTIRAVDENGDSLQLSAEGLLAQCLSHELDHLDGIVFVDKITEFVTE